MFKMLKSTGITLTKYFNFSMSIFNYKNRILRPIDWIKQPTEDVLRLISKAIYLLIKFVFQKKIF